MSETTALAFEVGCEEIPARFVAAAERDLGERLAAALGEARLLPPDPPALKTASTPRRLIAYAPMLRDRQPERVKQLVGPPAKAAFDKEGNPTRAAESFAARNRADLSRLKRVNTAKGEYVALDVLEPGSTALKVLVEILPAVLGAMTFPKNMYWTSKSLLFVRPIRWILAVLGSGEGKPPRVIPFEFAGVKSGNVTYGHRRQGSQPLAVTDLNLDLLLERHLVMVHGAERRERVKSAIKALLETNDFTTPADEFLESWVVNSTEWPVPLMGGFDPRYLALPREVLVAVMRDHQKYFAVEDGAGNLKPNFITVLNVEGDPKGLIRQGHERVLAARFADAEFFRNADRKVTLAQRVPTLERVMYQAKLGTYADKTRRMKALAEKICEELEKSGSMNATERQHALRAVELCKCDLTTQMVQEFTELQGIMGGLYAKSQGEPSEVADAIYDHYRPASAEDSCPRSVVGAVVSLADKLDSVVAGFAVGLEPTGSSDPFGLRRAGNGIVKIAAEKLTATNLDQLLDFLYLAIPQSLHLVSQPDLRGSIGQFLRERVEYFLRDVMKLRYDTTRAISNSTLGWEKPRDALLRGLALEKIRDSEDYKSLSQAAKRTRNILVKSANIDYSPGRRNVKADLFEYREEHELHQAFQRVWDELLRLEEKQEYEQAFRELASMRKPIDDFFDRVHVMTEQVDRQRNRLTLLNSINELIFSRLANLSDIEADTGFVKVVAG